MKNTKNRPIFTVVSRTTEPERPTTFIVGDKKYLKVNGVFYKIF